MSSGRFYNYLGSKERLLEAIIANVDDDTDMAEVVALSNLQVIRLAYDEPDFARLIVNIGHSEALFDDAVHGHRGSPSRGLSKADIEVLLTTVIGRAFALIRVILDGRPRPTSGRSRIHCAMRSATVTGCGETLTNRKRLGSTRV